MPDPRIVQAMDRMMDVSLFTRTQHRKVIDAIHVRDDESTREGIYILTDTSGTVQYVGKTSNGIYKRLRQHRTQGDRLFFSGQFYDLDFYFLDYQATKELRLEWNLNSLSDLERYLIQRLNPHLNVQHKHART